MKITACLILILFFCNTAYAGVRGQLRQGGQFYKDKKYGSALNSYHKILKNQPDNPQALFNAGNAYYRLKEYSQAQESYQKAAKSLGEHTQNALFNLGNAYYQAGDTENAKEAFKAAIVQNPADKEAAHNLQLILQQEKQQQNQQNQNQPQQDPQNNQGRQDNPQQGQQPDEQSQQEPQNGQMSKQDADRIMSMAKEQEHRSASGNRARTENLVDKDW